MILHNHTFKIANLLADQFKKKKTGNAVMLHYNPFYISY